MSDEFRFWMKTAEMIERRPMYYRRDGTPLFDTETTSALFEFANLHKDHQYRTVGSTRTLYGERLSTVWLGIDHNFTLNPLAVPIIFETMLFAPEILIRDIRPLLDVKAVFSGEAIPDRPPPRLRVRVSNWLRKLYPQDGSFQIRYATEAEAEAGHRRAKLQCLIPPLLRRLILYKIGKDDAWS